MIRSSAKVCAKKNGEVTSLRSTSKGDETPRRDQAIRNEGVGGYGRSDDNRLAGDGIEKQNAPRYAPGSLRGSKFLGPWVFCVSLPCCTQHFAGVGYAVVSGSRREMRAKGE